jgi:hypothetical protein
MSENSSQIGAFPMGAGILFVSDNLSSLQNTEPFHSFTLKDYLQWKDKRMYDPRPLQPYEPVGYFDMGSTTKIVDKIASKTPCKYVKLVPTAFKKTPNNSFPQEKFNSYPIEFKFFGIIGEELDSKIDSEISNEPISSSAVVQTICNTHSNYSIQMYNSDSDTWETIHEEASPIAVQEIQTVGQTFNISAQNMDKSLSWFSSGNITGNFKTNITNSKIQINMIKKLRVVVSKPHNWSLIGFKLSPKALTNIERNNKGIFSHIPVKILRS